MTDAGLTSQRKAHKADKLIISFSDGNQKKIEVGTETGQTSRYDLTSQTAHMWGLYPTAPIPICMCNPTFQVMQWLSNPASNTPTRFAYSVLKIFQSPTTVCKPRWDISKI